MLESITTLLTAGGLSLEMSGQWFRPTTYDAKVGFGVKKCPAYGLTREGFTVLVMGYTGAKAMQFKVAYVQRLNEMEQALRSQPVVQPVLPQSYKEALLALVAAEEEKSIAASAGQRKEKPLPP